MGGSYLERERCCVSCRHQLPWHLLLKITYSQKYNQFSLNGEPPIQGRSAYVCKTPQCIQTALKAKKLQRALKRAIPDDILRYLNKELEGLDTRGSNKSKDI